MKHSEVALVLAKVAAFDNRKVDEMVVASWSELLEDIDFEDAITAVREHFRHSDRWIMPSHVIAGVAAIRSQRLVDITELEPPDADPNDVPAYLAALRAGRRQAARPQTANVREITWQPKGVPAP